MRFSPRTVGLVAAVVTVLIWTSFIVIARASASHTLLPLDIALMRILGASCVLLPWAWWRMRPERARGERVGSLLGLSPLPLRTTVQAGFFGGLLYAVLAYTGFFYAPAAHASVLMPGSLPLWTTLLAIWLLHEKIPAARALGLACIVLGDLLVGGMSLLKAFEGGEVWKGDLLFMCAASCWAAYTVTARRLGLDAVRATMAITAFAFVFFVPVFALATGLGWWSTHIPQASWGELLFQAAFQGGGSVVISGITFTQMVRHFGPVRTTMITALVPGLSALGAVAVLGEPMHWNLLAGLALVTGGILLGVRAARPATAPLAQEAGR
ncbi:DMT family transporter [Limnohabitans sp.]|jgi:drug/metabolite transporter (DMT)-like permease|uniref:DMT family transporter n=1 Tax=Limnohabitans sp. TaxID=1907725 RepID=UPI0035B213C7